MILSLMFSACACTSLLNFHESQAPVFSHCEQFLPSFSPIPPRTSSLSTASFTGTALQVTARISPHLSRTNVPRKTPQNLRPQDFISHIPVLNSAGTALQVTPRIISLEYHACRIHTQPLISAKPSTMAQKDKGINIGIHVFRPCLLMSFDVFPCTQIYSKDASIFIYIYIFKYTIYKSRCTSSKCEREVLEATSDQS